MTKLFDKKKKKEKAQSDPVSQMQGINVATRKEEFFWKTYVRPSIKSTITRSKGGM